MKKSIIILSIFITSACSGLNSSIQEELVENKCFNCGTIVFLFNKDFIEDKSFIPTRRYIFSFLNVLIKVNNNVEFEERINDNKKFIKMVPEGKIKISYTIFTQSHDGVYSYTGFKDDSGCFNKSYYNVKEKELNLDVNSGQIVYLKIMKSGEIHQRCTRESISWVGSMELQSPFQEVAFEVEKIEDAKPEDYNRNK